LLRAPKASRAYSAMKIATAAAIALVTQAECCGKAASMVITVAKIAQFLVKMKEN